MDELKIKSFKTKLPIDEIKIKPLKTKNEHDERQKEWTWIKKPNS